MGVIMKNGSVGGIQNKTEKKIKWCILCCLATLLDECGVREREKTCGGVRVGRVLECLNTLHHFQQRHGRNIFSERVLLFPRMDKIALCWFQIGTGSGKTFG